MSETIIPSSESLHRALRWISERRREKPDSPSLELVDEAGREFDLSPSQQEWLLATLRTRVMPEPPSPPEVKMARIRHLVVATDFSAPADAALALAVEVAREIGAQLTLIHAWNPPVAVGLPDMAVGAVTASREAAEVALAARTQRVADLHQGVDAHIVDGAAPDAIVRETSKLGGDLLIVGTHGRGGVQRLILGSVAEQVVRKATCPVLTVRSGVR
jgi:nucleotide-binding universal stress UspA family protein